MSSSVLKRKSPYENHLFHEKKIISDDIRKPMEFNEMCDHVIDMILCHLDLADLATVSDTNRRLKNIAGSVFSRKYSHHLISMDAFDLEESPFALRRSDSYVYCKNKVITRTSDPKIWFKLLRNFGEYIKFLRIECVNMELHKPYKPNILCVLENMNKYIFKYCSDSLEILQLHLYAFFKLIKPLTKLQDFTLRSLKVVNTSANNVALEMMPNLRTLNLNYVPKMPAKYFSKLERVFLELRNDEHVNLFISLLHKNRHIKYVALRIFEKEITLNYKELIYPSIDEMEQIDTLKLDRRERINGNSPFQEDSLIYHFKTIKTFSYFPSHRIPFASFKFDHLEQFTLTYASNMEWLNFILRNKKLKILEFNILSSKWFSSEFVQNFLSEMPELEQIIVKSAREDSNLIFGQSLGYKWEQTQIEVLKKYFPELPVPIVKATYLKKNHN